MSMRWVVSKLLVEGCVIYDNCARRENLGVEKQTSRGENACSVGWVYEACAVSMQEQ